MIERLPEDAQTLHSELLALLLLRERDRDWSHLSGSFANKRVKGREYVTSSTPTRAGPGASSR